MTFVLAALSSALYACGKRAKASDCLFSITSFFIFPTTSRTASLRKMFLVLRLADCLEAFLADFVIGMIEIVYFLLSRGQDRRPLTRLFLSSTIWTAFFLTRGENGK